MHFCDATVGLKMSLHSDRDTVTLMAGRLFGMIRFSQMMRLAPSFKLRVKSIRSKDLMAIYIRSSYVWPRPVRGMPRSGECAWATYRFLHGV